MLNETPAGTAHGIPHTNAMNGTHAGSAFAGSASDGSGPVIKGIGTRFGHAGTVKDTADNNHAHRLHDAITSLPELMAQDNVRGLVFDLDGTLIDSAADIIRSLRVTFREVGLGELPEDYFPDNLHGTSDGIMRSVIQTMGWAEPADLNALKAIYVKNYAKLGHTLTKVYAGVPAMLDTWADRLPLGICTNKRFGAAIMATETVGIREHFKVISGADTWEQAKPSPVPLLATIQALGIEPEQCLYFGDTSVDAECAQRAGVRFVLHESGYGDKDLHSLPRAHAFKRWSDWF